MYEKRLRVMHNFQAYQWKKKYQLCGAIFQIWNHFQEDFRVQHGKQVFMK